ncbi:dienelactone hydrolase family protein [Demequina sp. NBRC 110055]|uniref:dienelactone hydrolase family protein n=1 Tax=Demequina sp. NBRC 110055 TaxID=1570344 RepID=UPI000A051765|nr:dienelactone hydrolase family protein [Demequina sp. NBRC 110055]
MAQILLLHHIQGLTDGVRTFADSLRAAGHTVVVPDLFDGHTFDTIEDGFAWVRSQGFDEVRSRGLQAADAMTGPVVYAGLSFGVTMAQRLAQTRPDAAGALLLHSCMPVSEYSEAWPAGVPVQIHGMTGDEFFDEDLPAARALVEGAGDAELFEYDGSTHLFTDASLPDYDAAATSLVIERSLSLLERVESP